MKYKKMDLEKMAKKIAATQKISFKKAFERVMRRVDAGLDPLSGKADRADKKQKPSKKKSSKKESAGYKNFVTPSMAILMVPKSALLDGGKHEKKDVADAALFKPSAVEEYLKGSAAENAPDGLSVEANREAAAIAGAHYDLKPCKESIEIIEQVMARENLLRVASFEICQALKYLLRVGVKSEGWRADIGKAENYLHRALTGEWIQKKV